MKIAYKIISAGLAVIILAVLVFSPLVYVGIESLAAQLLLTIGQATGNSYANELINEKGQITDHIGIDISVSGIFGKDTEMLAEIINSISDTDNENVMRTLEPVIAPFFVFVAVLVLVAICAIVTAVLAFVVKDNRKVICSCVTGVFLSLMVPECFKAVSIPFTNGDITLSKLAGNSWLALVGEIDKVELTSVFWFVPVIFGVIILWTMLYNYTLPADEKKKRLEMIGEAEAE